MVTQIQPPLRSLALLIGAAVEWRSSERVSRGVVTGVMEVSGPSDRRLVVEVVGARRLHYVPYEDVKASGIRGGTWQRVRTRCSRAWERLCGSTGGSSYRVAALLPEIRAH
jgi:hypothetical protein